MLDERAQRRLAKKMVKAAQDLEYAEQDIENSGKVLQQMPHQSAELCALERSMAEMEQSLGIEPETAVHCESAVSSRPRRRFKRPANPLDAMDALVTPEMVEQMEQESLVTQLRWNRFDVAAVGSAGVLGALVDFFLVGLPSGASVGPLTLWLKQYDVRDKAGRSDALALIARRLETVCKVPFDTLRADEAIAGMCGHTHRFQTLGHDPVLGLVFGVLDILRGTVTGFSYDKLSGHHQLIHLASPSGEVTHSLTEAFLRQLGHLLSDVATPAGLPAPMMTLLQAFNTGEFGPEKRSLGEVARWMYTKGYDLRHFLVSGLGPGTVEAILRGLLLLREAVEGAPALESLKFERMRTTAHALAALGNAGRLSLTGGNPLAFNQAQWMVFFKLLGPVMRDHLLQDELALAHQRAVNRKGWDELVKRCELSWK